MDFTSLNLCQPLLDALDEIGYISPTPIQAQAIPDLIEGRGRRRKQRKHRARY